LDSDKYYFFVDFSNYVIVKCIIKFLINNFVLILQELDFMSSFIERRNYNMTDADLCMFASILEGFITRDILDFEKFGVDAPKIASFKAKGDAFEVFPSDKVLTGNVLVVTDSKNTLRSQVLTTITEMLSRVEAKFGVDSPRYNRLAVKNPSKLNDESLLATARMLHLQISEYAADLLPFGLTPEVLGAFEDLNEQFELEKKAQADAIASRDENTRERIIKGNELYDLVSTYCNFGKILYEKTNYAKYNDYIIYDSFVGGSLTAPENLSVDVGTMTFSWSSVENSTSYQLLTSIAGDIWVEVYAGPDNFVNYVPPSPGLAMYKVKARSSSGYGPESAVMYYNYQAVIAPPGYISLSVINANTGAIAINWESVEGASFFRLFSSQVAIGAEVPGVYTLVGEYTTASYSGTVPTGYRYWFYVISGSSEEMIPLLRFPPLPKGDVTE
jgi:hypothetical protein